MNSTLCLLFSFGITGLISFSSAVPFYGDPPDETHPWAVHDGNRPQPKIVVPGSEYGDPPSDATILLDASQESFQNWQHLKPAEKRESTWSLKEGVLRCQAGAGDLASLIEFGDCQLHLEWATPLGAKKKGQARANSGVFLMGMIEVQILDNYENPTYADGMAGAVYGVMPPAVNALRPPGEWQAYDIIFRRPIVRDGELMDPGSLTVLMNGVIVQDSTALEGGGGWKKRQPLDRVFPAEGPLVLQDHGNPVRFRNIWFRPLRPRANDGGFDGRLAPELALAKRKQLAATIREDATQLQGLKRALRLLESLIYEDRTDVREQADALLDDYLNSIEDLGKSALAGRKGEILSLAQALDYMQRHAFIGDTHHGLLRVQSLVEANGWKLKKIANFRGCGY